MCRISASEQDRLHGEDWNGPAEPRSSWRSSGENPSPCLSQRLGAARLLGSWPPITDRCFLCHISSDRACLSFILLRILAITSAHPVIQDNLLIEKSLT